MEILLILIIILFLAYFYYNNKNVKKAKTNYKRQYENTEEEILEPINNEYDYPYTKKFLLTKNEWYFYKQLKPITDKSYNFV